ncbi:ribonuclease [Bibersteinia trehalosi]|uniref:ribonuclease T2 family protein n=1 Tax=Bibersteinia trehalosi TaxID=47735 RepID=UPI003D27BCA7
MKKHNSQPLSKRSSLNQLLFIIIILIFAIFFTWIKNEEKAQQSSTSKSEIQLPTSLGNYDTVMANDNLGQNKKAGVDYYQLALSWSPSFCELQKRKNEGDIPKHLRYQCDNAAKFGWVIHGLWPQAASARSPSEHPRFCQGDLPPLSEELIKQHMPESPGANLLQGQWEKHGACAFNSADSYFAKQKELFLQLKLPEQAMSRKELFAWLKQHNPQLKNAYIGASKTELYICYDKQWNVIDCPKN